MAKLKRDLLQGTLDLLILKALALGPQHGWGISQRLQQISKDVLRVNQGSLYPAVHRLEDQGWIASTWGTSENNRQAPPDAGGGLGSDPPPQNNVITHLPYLLFYRGHHVCENPCGRITSLFVPDLHLS